MSNAQHITFGSPRKLSIGGSNLLQSNLPKSFEGLTQTNTLVNPNVVSFILDPVFKNNDPDDELIGVCVKNIQSRSIFVPPKYFLFYYRPLSS